MEPARSFFAAVRAESMLALLAARRRTSMTGRAPYTRPAEGGRQKVCSQSAPTATPGDCAARKAASISTSPCSRALRRRRMGAPRYAGLIWPPAATAIGLTRNTDGPIVAVP